MVEKPELAVLLRQNPRAKDQAKVIGEALRLLQALRLHGVSERRYDLEGPFGSRSWVGARLRGKFKLNKTA